MELSVQTFLWLRDKGGLASSSGTPASAPGTVIISAEGLQEISSGLPVVRVLHRYCCHRFETPESLLPMVFSTTPLATAKSSSNMEVVRTHNWSVVSKIVLQALQFEVPEAQLDAIRKQGDALEALLVVKLIFELMRNHREKERETREQHKSLFLNESSNELRRLLESKSVGASKRMPHERKASPGRITEKPVKPL